MKRALNERLYAIVDIETTGGQMAQGSITEIAVYIHNGNEIVHRYEQLVRPFYYIPRHITMLTGIDNDMVADAPTFEEIAADIFELLQDKIFVAHNVNFDYSFIKQHLANSGYEFSAPKLCTVRMSRKIFPGLRSYSLGNICAYLDIPIHNRHRAAGDTAATAILFEKLLASDTENQITQMLKKNSGEHSLPPNLPKTALDQLPQAPGIYFFHDQKGKVVYIGKAKNILKRVKSHFTGNKITKQRQHFLRDIYSISFEQYPTEFMALIAEAVAIKNTWPKYNRSLKAYEPKYGLFRYTDQNNLERLFIGKFNKSLLPIRTFHDLHSARIFLQELASKFNLCPELCKVGDCPLCKAGSYDAHENPDSYNRTVAEALESLQEKQASFFIQDKGRNAEERSIIWVEPGSFYAMGYVDYNISYNNPEEIRFLLQPFEGTFYLSQLLQKFARENPNKITRLGTELPIQQ
jgi:DNA polymerase-3 subunit epsilon